MVEAAATKRVSYYAHNKIDTHKLRVQCSKVAPNVAPLLLLMPSFSQGTSEKHLDPNFDRTRTLLLLPGASQQFRTPNDRSWVLQLRRVRDTLEGWIRFPWTQAVHP